MNERLDLTRAFVTTAVAIAAGHGSGIAAAEPGQVAWRVHFDGLYTDFEPVLGPNGTIVTGTADFVTAVNPDGSIRWSTPATRPTSTAMALSASRICWNCWQPGVHADRRSLSRVEHGLPGPEGP